MNISDLSVWRPATRQEISDYLEPKVRKKAKKGSVLIVRRSLRPVDIYSYLRARFGHPNGIQNALRSDDGDNWIHWDYNIKAGEEDVYIAGTSREIHIHCSSALSDADWLELIAALKYDFAKLSVAKNKMIKSFEKFYVFQNKYVSLANTCALLHEKIIDAPIFEVPEFGRTKRSVAKSLTARKRLSEHSGSLYSDCLVLSLLTPVMAEAYINMFILIFCKDNIRNDKTLYENFIRQNIPEKIASINQNCEGLQGAISKNGAGYKAFLQVMNKRNFSIHGNVDPIREKIETVYFEGKRPLFENAGDHHIRFSESLEQIFKPKIVVSDYENIHAFFVDIRNSLLPCYQRFFDQVINDPYPGYEIKKKRVTKILPETIMMSVMSGLRYDDELSANKL